jgi:thiamine transport system substrate-binding protein
VDPLVTISHKVSAHRRQRRALVLVVVAIGTIAAALAVGGCGGSDEAAPTEVVLVTHDSFAISKDVKRAFETESGLTLRILQGGDAGEVLNKALLSAGNPQGDVLFGVDDNLLSRALAGDLLEKYTSDDLDTVDESFKPSDPRVTPIDRGDVCLNIDRGWFAKHDVAPPRTLADLTLPRYHDLLVVENAATSTPGLAFLLATVTRFGETGWEGYWRKLRSNGVLVVDGWEEAYTQEFSGAAGSPGKRPIVVSYATSPAAEVIFASKPLDESPTAAVEDGCFRQIEYAGVLRGAPNADGAKKLIDFMLSERFQADVPGSMFVYPVRTGVVLPEEFTRFAIVPSDPLTLTPDAIAAGRDGWVTKWTDLVLR